MSRRAGVAIRHSEDSALWSKEPAFSQQQTNEPARRSAFAPLQQFVIPRTALYGPRNLLFRNSRAMSQPAGAHSRRCSNLSFRGQRSMVRGTCFFATAAPRVARGDSQCAGARWGSSLVAVKLLYPLAPLLRLDRQCRHRPRKKARNADRLARLLAIAV